MKKTLSLLAALTVAFGAFAVSSDAEASGLPTFNALPAAKILTPPKKKPASIGAGEHAKGFLTVVEQHNADAMFVVGSKNAADRLRGKFNGAEEDDDSNDFCFASDNRGRFRGSDDDDDPQSREWDTNMQSQVGMWKGSGEGNVQAVHLEHLVEDGDKASLEMTDAWVDMSTRGSRLIAKSTVPLELVGKAPGDIRVYAARDQERVQIILSEPKATTRSWRGIIQQSSSGMSQSSCRHARASLKVEKGSADTATFSTVAELPAEKTPEPPPITAGEDAPFAFQLAEVRNRPIHVHASVSWASTQKEPVVSVTFGWDAKDRRNEVSVPRGKKARRFKK